MNIKLIWLRHYKDEDDDVIGYLTYVIVPDNDMVQEF